MFFVFVCVFIHMQGRKRLHCDVCMRGLVCVCVWGGVIAVALAVGQE